MIGRMRNRYNRGARVSVREISIIMVIDLGCLWRRGWCIWWSVQIKESVVSIMYTRPMVWQGKQVYNLVVN